jgi:hypothetical protein
MLRHFKTRHNFLLLLVWEDITTFLCGGILKGAWEQTTAGPNTACTTLVACTSVIAKGTTFSENARKNTRGGATSVSLHSISSKRANYTVQT